MLCAFVSMVDSPEDKRKIEQLYEQYNRLMYVVAYHVLLHEQDAEDVVMSSWIKIIRYLDRIDQIDSKETKSFIVIVVERTAIDLYRKNNKRNNVSLQLAEFEQSPYLIVKEREYENQELYEVIHNMPKIYSEVLLLYYINGLATKEIADLLGVKASAVEKRLSRGRKQLREELKENE